MEKFSVSESGMKAGDVCQLVRASHVEMMIVDENHANVLVDGQVIMEGLALYEATDFAKRLNNPNLQDSTKFHTPREWTFQGKRLSNLIEGNLVFSVRSTENLSSDSRNKNTVNVVGQTCETCFTQVPLTGVCDFC